MPIFRGSGDTSAPTHIFTFTGGSIANLPQSLTVNGTTVSPAFRYEGKNALSSSWVATVGSDLSISGSDTPVNLGLETPLVNTTDAAVKFNLGQSYQSSDTTAGNLGTNDFVLEMMFRYPDDADASYGILGKSLGLFVDTGYLMLVNGQGLALYLETDSAVNFCRLSYVGLEPSTWYHVLVYFDRQAALVTNGLQMFVNGQLIAQGAVDAGTWANIVATDFTNSQPFTLGRASTTLGKEQVAYLALYSASNWLHGGDWAGVAAQRFAQVNGTWPSIGSVTSITPTRNSIASLEKVVSGSDVKVFTVGANWPRISQAIDVNGFTFTGYLAESGSVNLSLGSKNLADTTYWTVSGTIATTASVGVSPFGDSDATQIVFGSGSQWYQNMVSGSADTYTFSVYARSVGSSVAKPSLFCFDTNSSIQTGVKNLTLTPYWQRYNTSFAVGGTGSFKVGLINQDVSGAPLTMQLWGAQLEKSAFATSYVPTTVSASMRQNDILLYSGSFPATGTLAASTLVAGLSLERVLAQLSLGTDQVTIEVNDKDQDHGFVQVGGVLGASVAGNAISDQVYRVAFTYKTDNFALYTNGVLDDSLLTGSVPAALTTLAVGCTPAGTQQPEGLVDNVKLYKKAVTGG